MTQPRVELEGAATLARTLKTAADDIADLTDANDEAARIVASAAGGRAPRRTGRLAGSIRGSRGPGRAVISSAVPYARPIHWGTVKGIPPTPFLSDAAQETEPQWVDRYRRDVQTSLDKVRGVR